MKTKEELFNVFLQKALKKFGNKFNYSKVDYVSSRIPIIIICPIHGEFITTPVQFLHSKHGCKLCANESSANSRTNSTENFINQCKKVWGNLYTYDKTVYVNSLQKVIITCPIHGDFLTRPADFLRHHGCPKCKSNKTKITNHSFKISNKEEFVKKAELLYPNLFKYDDVIYIDSRTKVLVYSNLCNEKFYITPSQLIQGHFKKQYKGEKIKTKYQKRLTTEAFIQNARFVHGDIYDYSKTKYIDSVTKVTIICPKHGEFQMFPEDHTSHRYGCPLCHQSRGEEFISSFLKENQIQFIPQYKININGISRYIDFCLILGTKLIFIEYNGKQHYEPVEHFGGKETFEKQVQRDKDIKNYCLENNIPLLVYKYDIPFYELKERLINDINIYGSK